MLIFTILLSLSACHGDDSPHQTLPSLTPGVPVGASVGAGGFNRYQVSVSPGTLYKISMTSVNDDPDLLFFGSDSGFTATQTCSVDNTALTGISAEDCIIAAPAATLYFAVDGSFLSRSSAAFTLAVEQLRVTNLNQAIPAADSTTRTGAVAYAAAGTSAANYTVGITALNDDANLYVFGNDPGFTQHACTVDNTEFTGTTPEDCTVTSSGGALYFIVDGIFSTSSSVLYSAIATTTPAIPSPVNEGSTSAPAAQALDTPFTGQVAGGGTSFYSVNGLTGGTRYTVSILGLSNNASLTVYDGDSTFAAPAACLIDNTLFAGTTPEACTLTVSGGTLFFSVAANTTSGGVAYINLVEPGP